MTDRGDVDAGRTSVWVVWHVYVATVHDYEEVAFPRVFGVYSTESLATEAAARAAAQPGFDGELGEVDEVQAPIVEEYEVDDVRWRGGFFSFDAEGREE